MRLIRAADCRRMPWKNGGGETVEIAISPADANIDGFDWRLSMARVESDGPFSLFSGVDRTLAVLEGEGIVLSFGQQENVRLTCGSLPLSFAADVPTRAALIAGPITDLNMMTRRSVARHKVTRLAADAASNVAVEATELLLFCRSGAVRIGEDAGMRLGPLDTLHMEDAPKILPIEAEEPADLFLVEITRAA